MPAKLTLTPPYLNFEIDGNRLFVTAAEMQSDEVLERDGSVRIILQIHGAPSIECGPCGLQIVFDDYDPTRTLEDENAFVTRYEIVGDSPTFATLEIIAQLTEAKA